MKKNRPAATPSDAAPHAIEPLESCRVLASLGARNDPGAVLMMTTPAGHFFVSVAADQLARLGAAFTAAAARPDYPFVVSPPKGT